MLRQNGRAVPLEPVELVDAVVAALSTLADAHDGDAPSVAGPKRTDPRRPLPERPAGPVAPERFGVLQALLAHLLAACGDERSAILDAAELAARFSIPLEELQDHLSLLNLVNFGGGCYAVYAEHEGDVVRVEKELYGDVFRRPPKLTPLEARAIHLAMEYVGPTIAADAHTPLKRVRRKLEETFGRFDLAGSPEPSRRFGRGGARSRALGRRRQASGRRDRVHEGGRREPDACASSSRTRSSGSSPSGAFTPGTGASTPHGRSASTGCDRPASRTITSKLETVSIRPTCANPRVARLLHSPDVARWKLERGARPLTDGSAIAEVPYKTEEWLLSEVLADRGETVVLEPQRLRDVVAKRARRLQRELGRVPSRR